MQAKHSRRSFVRSSLMAGAVLPIVASLAPPAHAAGLPPLDPTDPTAAALGFVTDTTEVDAAANPSHKPTQRCGTCVQFQGIAAASSGGCNIFAGKSVPSSGWCRVYAAK